VDLAGPSLRQQLSRDTTLFKQIIFYRLLSKSSLIVTQLLMVAVEVGSNQLSSTSSNMVRSLRQTIHIEHKMELAITMARKPKFVLPLIPLSCLWLSTS
jgi:hypothetical protein